MDQLDTAIQNAAQWGDTDIRIWDEFKKILKDTFKDRSKKENAFYDLEKLTMLGENLEEYIAKFNHLLKKTGWLQNMEGAAIYFQRGLTKGLFATILDREKPLPKDLEAWISAARDHHEAYLVKKHEMEFMGPQA